MVKQSRIRILCVDDHPMMRQGIATVIGSETDMQLVAEAGGGAEAILRFREHRPDITFMDLRLPDMSGIDALIAIRSEFAEARIIMLTTFEGDAEIRRALQAGARGYLLKSMRPQELIEGISQVQSGKDRIPTSIAARIAEQLLAETFSDHS